MHRRDFLKAAGSAAAIMGAPGILRGAPEYEPAWDSLAKHAVPGWFRDGKFGLFFHWGIYSVPAFDNEWYSRNMYIEGSRANQYHTLVYGPTSKFGYKDFLPSFRGEKFDPAEWAELFRRSGARFAGPVTEHADGFAMWDSKLTDWNAARHGPRRDVVGELARAIRHEGLKFVTTFHHHWLWGWYPTANKNLDAGDPKYAGLYGPPAPGSPFDFAKPWSTLPLPPESFQEAWEAKVREVIDRYQPDHLYFDSRMEIIAERRRASVIAHHYNQAQRRGREVSVTYKAPDLPEGVGILDIECGRTESATPHVWQTDDKIEWNSWAFVQKPDYKPIQRLIGQLVDIVSKNGHLLLNINPAADGVIPEPTVERLLAIGRWLDVNGEAIYGTRPWNIFGEGPTKIKAGTFGEKQTPEFTAQDIRFTSRWKTVYAIVLDWPAERELVIKTLTTNGGPIAQGEIAHVSLLGSDASLDYVHSSEGLRIPLPLRKPCDWAVAFKILLK